VESWNSKLGYYIPALVRKTKCYFKSLRIVKMAMDFLCMFMAIIRCQSQKTLVINF
jgi:hypothetical protein